MNEPNWVKTIIMYHDLRTFIFQIHVHKRIWKLKEKQRIQLILRLSQKIGWLVVGIKGDCLTRDLGL